MKTPLREPSIPKSTSAARSVLARGPAAATAEVWKNKKKRNSTPSLLTQVTKMLMSCKHCPRW